MSTLNIMGNGFDLYHGLPTQYYDFACYMLSTDEPLYTELAEMYDFPIMSVDSHTNIGDYQIADQFFWRDFEKNLGYLSPEWVENTLPDDLGLETPEAVSLTVPHSDRTDDVKTKLNDWILSIDTSDNFQQIRSQLGSKKLLFSHEDAFISFNYTHTLEHIYHIANVFHIHGSASSGNFPNDLILGHGNSAEINTLNERIEQLRNEPYSEYSQANRNRIAEYTFERSILTQFQKPTDLGLAHLHDFLDTINTPDCICTYGFSFGKVDDPYILYLRSKYPSAKWKFSYYSSQDIHTTIERVVQLLHLETPQYECFEFYNPNSNAIRDELIRRNHITYYSRQ